MSSRFSNFTQVLNVSFMDLFYVNFKRLAMLVLLMKINLSWLDKFLTRLHSRLSTQGCCFPSQIPISPFPERKDNNIFWKISLAQYAQKNYKEANLIFFKQEEIETIRVTLTLRLTTRRGTTKDNVFNLFLLISGFS